MTASSSPLEEIHRPSSSVRCRSADLSELSSISDLACACRGRRRGRRRAKSGVTPVDYSLEGGKRNERTDYILMEGGEGGRREGEEQHHTATLRWMMHRAQRRRRRPKGVFTTQQWIRVESALDETWFQLLTLKWIILCLRWHTDTRCRLSPYV